MTPDQTSIPVPEPAGPTSPGCTWCGTPTSLTLVLQKERWGTAANGSRELRKPAQVVPCCEEHLKSLERTGDS